MPQHVKQVIKKITGLFMQILDPSIGYYAGCAFIDQWNTEKCRTKPNTKQLHDA